MDVYLAKADYAPPSEAHANLSLPTMPYELFDALDQARVQQGDELYFEITDYHAFECMEPFIAGANNLVELNALCQKLSELDERQSAAFEGLLKMEVQKKDGPIGMDKLINFAYSTDCCHVVDTALNDSQLGRFYAENGFVPEVEGLSDRLFDLLDFERIGREMRQSEGGVFAEHGYVVQHSELNEIYRAKEFHIRTPDYEILLEDMQGNRIELPAQNPPSEGAYACVDCRIPMLMAAIDVADIQEVNAFGETLKGMGDKTMRKYKAVLSVSGCDSLKDAVVLAEHLSEYLFDEKVTGLRDLALAEMNFMMDADGAALLARYVDLAGYGKAVLESDCAVITPYGHLVREDHQMLRAPLERQTQAGMEMI
jgi:hypothetical protein